MTWSLAYPSCPKLYVNVYLLLLFFFQNAYLYEKVISVQSACLALALYDDDDNDGNNGDDDDENNDLMMMRMVITMIMMIMIMMMMRMRMMMILGIERLKCPTLWRWGAVRWIIHLPRIHVSIFVRWGITIEPFLSDLVLVFLGLFICRRKQHQLLNIQPTRQTKLKLERIK